MPCTPSLSPHSDRSGWIIRIFSGLTALALTHGAIAVDLPDRGNEVEQARPIVAPLQTEFVYEAIVTIEAPVEVGPTPQGRKRYIPITGGTFSGPRLSGVILPGGADWQTDRADGTTEVDALYSMQCHDGTRIVVRNLGVIVAGGAYMRTAPRFEVPDGPHVWLSQAQFVGSISGGPRPGTVIIRVFRVL